MSDLLYRAARLLEQARTVRERYPDDNVPADAARQIKKLLGEASSLRKQAESDTELNAAEAWMAEPQHKHDMSNGASESVAAAGVAPGWEPGGPAHQNHAGGLSRSTKSFVQFVRGGIDSLPPERKADLVENPSGLNVVPVDYAGTILKELAREGVIRSLAFLRPTTKPIVDVGNVTIGTPTWGVLETGSDAPDGLAATPADKDTIKVHDLTALVKIGRDELEDSDENLAEIVRTAVAQKFAEVEDDAFAGGTGDPDDMPYAIHHDVTQNVTAAAAGILVADDLKKLTFRVSARHRRNGIYLGHSQVEEAVALMKDAEGRYLLQPSTAAGEPMTLFGYRWYTVDGLPDLTQAGADDPSLLFGDLRAGYMIADRRRLTVQRLEELYAAEGKIGLMFTHRVGGDVIRPMALAKYLV